MGHIIGKRFKDLSSGSFVWWEFFRMKNKATVSIG